ncbi:unnamed protein product [Symbiodinium natans]|uniref:Uncharacterized protein n=1 Tax=Symbiodinium natans TaxID=878477 RepID=A0A812G046_9DINO|nr:unnamed protein product [Symbiodinium natans]
MEVDKSGGSRRGEVYLRQMSIVDPFLYVLCDAAIVQLNYLEDCLQEFFPVQLFSSLLDATWPGFSGKALPTWATGAPLLVFSFCQFCELQQTADKEIQVGVAKIEETEGILGSWKSTVKTKTQVQEHRWNWTTTWRLDMTSEGARERLTLLSGSRGTTLETVTTPPAEPHQPRPTAECAPTLELDMTWLARRLRNGTVDFAVNRTAPDCHTPARNQDIQAALRFFNNAHTFGEKAANTLLSELGTLLSQDPGDVFQPVSALFALEGSGSSEASRPVLAADMDVVLAWHRRSLLAHREGQHQRLERTAAGSDDKLDRSLVSLLIVVQEMASLARQMTSAIRELERMLYDQLTAAIGKKLLPIDFGEYMEFHGRELLREEYQTSSFVFAVRRAQHHPEGTVSIEAPGRHSHQAISTFSLHRAEAPAMRMQLSSAATISLTGEHFVHAAVFHRFARHGQQDLRLVARARQLSCFVLLVGKIISSDTFKPTAALIIQNKDDLVIPLLLETVPSPKEFLDSIQSLSPEQQRFAKAFRKMQLSSSLFALAIVQIKPALEKVLNLPENSLTKEIQLTQDLIELFVRYQVAPDLMSYEPWSSLAGLAEKAARVGAAEKLGVVKAHVKSLWETIAASKQKQLQEKEEETKMYKMESCGAEGCSSYAGRPQASTEAVDAQWSNYREEPKDVPSMRFAKHDGGRQELGETVMYMSAMPKSGKIQKAVGPMLQTASAQEDPRSPPASPPQAPQPSPPQAPPSSSSQGPAAAQADSSGTVDYTALPHRLDANYLKFDTDAVLRPTNIDVATVWTKQEQPGLLGEPRTRQLRAADQREETNKAFDLLDALSRSGAEALESSLHILVAATHCFDETILNTLVQQPLGLMTAPLLQLVNPAEADRVRHSAGSLRQGPHIAQRVTLRRPGVTSHGAEQCTVKVSSHAMEMKHS